MTYIELQNATDGSYDFVGLMSFALPVEDDMEVTKATLRLTTKRVKQSRATVSLFAYSGEWAENAKYEDQEANVTAARATTALATFTPEGQLNKDVASDEITTEKYQIITGWQNSIDLTEYVKGQECIYTLNGQRVDKLGRGIYIVNGKKIINK